VKFQKTCLHEKFNSAALERPYVGPNSWGSTYGEHKQHLEFSDSQFKELQRYACEIGIFFSASAMDMVPIMNNSHLKTILKA
jgi:sialic acid synthase